MKQEGITDKKLERLLESKFNDSYMSNPKWVKLISCLVSNHDLIKKCQVKLIYDQKQRELILTGDELFNHDYYLTSMESMVTDPIVPGWTLYKEIESLNFPESFEIKGKLVTQDLEKIKNIINNIGSFQMNHSKNELIIIAYN